MASLFTKIIDGELPGRFVWRDDEIVAFLTIQPLRAGHTLVVPRIQVEHWIDLDAGTLSRLMAVCQQIGRVLQQVWQPAKVGVILAGLEVPHVHVHLVPIDTMTELDFARVDPDPDAAELDAAADRIRAALRQAGAPGVSD